MALFDANLYDNGAETVWFSPVDIVVFYSHSIVAGGLEDMS